MKLWVMVHLLMFDKKEQVRPVKIEFAELPVDPEKRTQALLNMTFQQGQNDFQPRQMPSVSAGDIVFLEGRFYLVENVGFSEISFEQYTKYCKMPQIERQRVLWSTKTEGFGRAQLGTV